MPLKKKRPSSDPVPHAHSTPAMGPPKPASASDSWLSKLFGTTSNDAAQKQAAPMGPVPEATPMLDLAASDTATQGEATEVSSTTAVTEEEERGGPYTDVYGGLHDDENFVVDEGQITFDAEGTEGGRYHTRVIHWPGGASGITVGRGYDMGFRTRTEVEADLTAAGVPAADAASLAGGAGRSGPTAGAWYRANKSTMPEISASAQKALFEGIYPDYSGEVERISGNWAEGMARATGGDEEDYEVDWEATHPALRDVVVDLRYRGDYTATTRRRVQPLLVANDLEGMYELMSERRYWSRVPEDRFNRRKLYLEEALGKLPAPDPTKEDPEAGAGAGGVGDRSMGTYEITARSLNVRGEPVIGDNIVGSVQGGERVQVLQQNASGWLQIEVDGQAGWISGNYARRV